MPLVLRYQRPSSVHIHADAAHCSQRTSVSPTEAVKAPAEQLLGDGDPGARRPVDADPAAAEGLRCEIQAVDVGGPPVRAELADERRLLDDAEGWLVHEVAPAPVGALEARHHLL